MNYWLKQIIMKIILFPPPLIQTDLRVENSLLILQTIQKFMPSCRGITPPPKNKSLILKHSITRQKPSHCSSWLNYV